MKLRKAKSLLSLITALAVSVTVLPTTLLKVNAQTAEPTVIYSNDFEDSTKLPTGKTSADIVNVNGSKAVKFDVEFDSTSTWDEKATIELNYEYAEPIASGAKLQMDLLLPYGSTYAGTIKVQGITQIGNGWTWTQSNTIPEFASSDFTTTNGYKLKTVEIPFSDNIASEVGLHRITLKVVGYQCDYNGSIYVDNVRLLDAVPPVRSEKVYLTNDFEDSAKLPTGKTESDLVSGVNGSKAVSFDYVFDKNSTWDQKDIQIPAEYTEPIAAGAKLKVDILFPKSVSFTGSISLKAAVQLGGAWIWTEADAMQSIPLTGFTAAGDYILKTVEFTFGRQIAALQGLHQIFIQVVGNGCDYTGKVYIDNLKLVEGPPVADKYVEITSVPTNQTVVNKDKLTIPTSVNLVDAKATSKTTALYAYLGGVGKSDYLLFGHQNDTHHKAGPKEEGFTNSDSKDLTGSYSGVVGIDSLSLTGAEYSVPTGSTDDIVTATAKLMIEAANEGSIISMSAHMPNFDLVVKKGKNASGNYDYSGYTPGVTSGNVVQRVMPGGDLNEAFLGYLDLIAGFGKKMEAADIPVLFRPYHEHTGSWFWWGAAHCDPAAYNNLWKYTVEYLRDIKGVHNFLYVYSTGGIDTEEAYLERYPGDDYVDIMGFDMYNNDPTSTDGFPEALADTMDLVAAIAVKHKKVSAVTETGMIVTGENGFAISGNKRLTWFNEVHELIAKTDAAYFLTWANFGEGSGIFQPYKHDAATGHEMSNNFIDFYNDEHSVFADGIEYSGITVTNTKSSEHTTAYITTPYSGYRILAAATLKASVKNADKAVNFVLKDSKGTVLNTLPAVVKDGIYTADVTANILRDIAPTYGTIELTVGETLYDKIRIFFNIAEEKVVPEIVDTFESYFGNNEMLALKWATNAGSGCSVTPTSTDNADRHNNGNFGLAFNYKISTEKTTEGWAGITKALPSGTDWSAFDAYQLWIKPDGKGQKLVIQITSNGEDFEVHLPEFAATTEAKLMTIPFSQFKGKNKGTFDPTKVTQVGIWCNTIVPEGHQGAWTVDSQMYFDDIRAVNTKDTTPTTPITPETASTVNTDSAVVISVINSVTNNGKVTVDVTNKKSVAKEIFDAIKGTDKTVTFTQNGVEWTFYGKDIINTTKAIDMTVNVATIGNTTTGNKTEIKNVVKDNDVIVLSFANNGQLPGKAMVKIKLDTAWFTGKNKNNINIYYYNETTKSIEVITSGLAVDVDGYVAFDITHNSDYIVSDVDLTKVTTPTPEEPKLASTVRLAGANRYETSVKVSQAGWTTSDNAVLTRGDQFADALTAAPFAKQLNAPILLTETKKLTSSTAAELKRLKVKKVYIIGGTGAISTAVENAVKAIGITIERISGSDRYATSLAIANKLTNKKQVFLATGTSFADALSISSYAAATGSPILLAANNQITAGVTKFIKANGSKVYVIGGSGVIADSVVKSISGAERISGADRYATNLSVLNKFASGFSFSKIYYATGESFPDALSGSVLAAASNSPIVLVEKAIPEGTKKYLNNKSKDIKEKFIIGGEGIVPSTCIE